MTEAKASFFMRGKGRNRGFTLPELLVVMSIIGTLATVGTVSYSSARASARDVKRVSDLKQVQTALELFFENNSFYPPDGRAGREGTILGVDSTKVLSDAGFAPKQTGTLYMILVPANPPPNGIPYVYRSLQRDGSDCDSGRCEAYAILFSLERPQGNYLAGPHAMTPAGIAGAEGGYAGEGIKQAGGEIVGLKAVQAQLAEVANSTTFAVEAFVEDKNVKTVNQVAVAPAVAAAAIANTAITTGSTLSYAFLFLSQPFLMFGRRKRKAWGTVYNPLSRLGEDLVIVRLRDAQTNRIVKSTVTDIQGRFSFLAQAGRYRIEAAKNGFAFPSALTANKREDGPFTDLYHGEVIEVGTQGAILTPNIPLDPVAGETADDIVLKKDRGRKLQRVIAAASPVLGGLSFVITPSVFVGLLFAAQVVTYLLFRRLATPPEPKNWGIVYEQVSRRPVPHAILRIFEAKYNKLLESQVTDRHGRYHFRVGGNVYYLTVTKPGFQKTETDPIDLSATTEPTVIASDLPLAVQVGIPVPPPGPTPPPNTKMGAGYDAGKPPAAAPVKKTEPAPEPQMPPAPPTAAPVPPPAPAMPMPAAPVAEPVPPPPPAQPAPASEPLPPPPPPAGPGGGQNFQA